MDERITELKRKIVKLEDFFRDMANVFSNKAGLRRIHFLMPDNKTGDFITAFSANDSNIWFPKYDLTAFHHEIAKKIFYPRKVLWDWGFLKRLRHFQIIWKVYVCGISAIVPTHGSEGMICLIVFCDRHADGWFSKNTEFASMISKHMTFCLEAIRLYNQTLEGIIRKHDPLYRRLHCPPVQSDDEQTPVLIEKKVEFL